MTVLGTSGKDFIHEAGDGHSAPAGYVDNPGLTGGEDTVSAGAGDDLIYMGSTLDAGDSIDGSGDNDTVEISGDYFSQITGTPFTHALTLGASTLLNVETLRLDSGIAGHNGILTVYNGYDITLNSGNAPAGGLTIDGSALDANNALTIDGSALTNPLTILAGDGPNILKGGSANDTFTLPSVFNLSNSSIDGGGGTSNAVAFDFSQGTLNLFDPALKNIQQITLNGGGDSTVMASQGPAGPTPFVNANATSSFTFDGHTTTDASFVVGGSFAGDNTITGGAQADQFFGGSGNNAIEGNDGDDQISVLLAAGAIERIDGGNGNDTVTLDALGNGGVGFDISFDDASLQNVETLAFDYLGSLTMADGNVAAGQTLDVAFRLADFGDDDPVIFNGSAETDGSYNFDLTFVGPYTHGYSITGGAGNDSFVLSSPAAAGDPASWNGGGGINTLDYSTSFGLDLTIDARSGLATSGSSQDDFSNFTVFRFSSGTETFFGSGAGETVYMLKGGIETAEGFGGDDHFFLGATLGTLDVVDGGIGNDTLTLDGDYSAGVTFNGTTVRNVETIVLTGGHSYSITTNQATVAANQTLTVDASGLGAGDALVFNGSAETDGKFNMLAGAGNDLLTGGLGADTFRFKAANLTSGDTVNGGTGAALDSLLFTTAGTIDFQSYQNVSHIEQIVLANGTNNTALTDALVGSADDNHVLAVIGGSGNDTVNAAAVTTAANRVFFTAGLGNDTLTGGLGADTFYFSAAGLTGLDTVNGGGGVGLDRIVFTTAGTIAATAFQGVTHVEQLVLANGTNNVTLANAMVAASDDGHILSIVGGTGNDSVNASALTSLDRAYITAGSGSDTLTGGAGLDIFYFAAADLTAADTVNGGAGASVDVLSLTTAGTVAAAAFQNVSHVEEVVLANGTDNLTVPDALVSSADDGHVLYAIGGSGNDTINAGAVTTATNRIYFVSGAGNDNLTGGLGADDFFFAAADLTASDTVNGGTGTSVDSILFTTAGTIAASAFTNVSHIEQLYLAAAGASSVTLSNALVTSADDGHILHVTGGTGADTINAAAVTTATNRVVFIGGGGADVLTAGSGADFFAYLSASNSTSTGYDTITGFSFTADRFDIPGGAGTITAVEAARNGALDSGANFDTELAARFSTLAGHHAGLLTATSGTLSGQTFLVVDLNGTAGYQAGADLVIHLAGATGTLASGDFV